MIVTARPQAFRAGSNPGETTSVPAAHATVTASATSVLLADISEFQPDISDAAYLAWSKAIVIRAAYGDAHDDKAWYGGARRADLLAGGARFLGIYQYLVAAQDPAAQAKALAGLVGTLEQGEVVICDLEEGSGSQRTRLETWAHVIEAELGDVPWDYSGLNFAASAGIAPVTWVAAYQSAEPSPPHRLWQFTDAYAVPGVGTSDCSVFHGTIDQLAALAHGGAKPPEPQPPATAPPFPYPAADYLGLESPDPHCHSGYSAADRPHIMTWQSQMAARGWTISADGWYGTQSDGVCRAFQAEKHLTVDGKAGPATWAASWTEPVT